jgi:TRAP transporter 4TM/12TM fusion protein
MSDDNQNAGPRFDSVFMGNVVSVFAVLLTLGAIAWGTDSFRAVGLVLYTEQYLGGMLAIAFPLVYLAVPAGKERFRQGPVPWYDKLAALAGFLVSAFSSVKFPQLTELITLRPVDGLFSGGVMVVLLIEGLRRTAGRALTIVVIAFMIFALVGHFIPGMLQGRPVSFEKLIYYSAWDSTAILGVGMRVVTTIVIAFVLFGQLLFKAGGSEFFTNIAMAVMGRYRGGPAKISVFASGLFGSISGSVVSNIVSTGVLTIPMMRKGGYRAEHAGAIEAVASTGGQLMPPVMGAAAFLMAEFLGVEYQEIVLAALIPAILFYVALFIQADLEAARSGITRIDENLIPKIGPVLRSGWHFPLPFAVLLTALFVWNYSPETSALLAAATVAVTGVAIGYKGKRLTSGLMIATLRSTGLGVLNIIMIGAAAGLVIGVLNISGLGFGLTLALVQIASGNLLLLLTMAAIVCIILGMGMPTVGVYVLLAALVAPALIEVGINEIAAHMFILYFGMMSMITPPVAIGAFAAATLTGADPMRTGFAAMRFGWLAFVIPFMFVASPSLLMNAGPVTVILDTAGALAATWLISVAIIGYFSFQLSVWERALYGISGFCLILPIDAFSGAIEINLFGLFVALFLIFREFLSRRKGAQREIANGGKS